MFYEIVAARSDQPITLSLHPLWQVPTRKRGPRSRPTGPAGVSWAAWLQDSASGGPTSPHQTYVEFMDVYTATGEYESGYVEIWWLICVSGICRNKVQVAVGVVTTFAELERCTDLVGCTTWLLPVERCAQLLRMVGDV